MYHVYKINIPKLVSVKVQCIFFMIWGLAYPASEIFNLL
jgi:hypothetical protein